jgi:hypothetical protein
VVSGLDRVSVFLSWIQSAYISVISVVLYLFTRLAGYSVGLGISRGARKLVWTPWVIKNKKKQINGIN